MPIGHAMQCTVADRAIHGVGNSAATWSTDSMEASQPWPIKHRPRAACHGGAKPAWCGDRAEQQTASGGSHHTEARHCPPHLCGIKGAKRVRLIHRRHVLRWRLQRLAKITPRILPSTPQRARRWRRLGDRLLADGIAGAGVHEHGPAAVDALDHAHRGTEVGLQRLRPRWPQAMFSIRESLERSRDRLLSTPAVTAASSGSRAGATA